MGSNNVEESVLRETLNTFQHSRDGDSYILSPEQGIRLIEGWLQALRGDSNMDQLTGQLAELHTELQSTQPNGPYIRDLLLSLADKTQEFAEGPDAEGTWTGSLESLSKILRHIGNQV
jgi:hypothetical protein